MDSQPSANMVAITRVGASGIRIGNTQTYVAIERASHGDFSLRTVVGRNGLTSQVGVRNPWTGGGAAENAYEVLAGFYKQRDGAFTSITHWPKTSGSAIIWNDDAVPPDASYAEIKKLQKGYSIEVLDFNRDVGGRIGTSGPIEIANPLEAVRMLETIYFAAKADQPAIARAVRSPFGVITATLKTPPNDQNAEEMRRYKYAGLLLLKLDQELPPLAKKGWLEKFGNDSDVQTFARSLTLP